MRQLKIVLMGAGGVGKTSLTTQFVREIFEHRYEPTIEEIQRKTIEVDGELCSLELLDTAGIEQFAQMRDVYIREGHGFILVYSIADKTTFDDIQVIHEEIVKTKHEEALPIILVGNKRDLAENSRDVETKDGENLATRWPHCVFMETSAICREDAEGVFMKAAREITKLEEMAKNKKRSSRKQSFRRRKLGAKCLVM